MQQEKLNRITPRTQSICNIPLLKMLVRLTLLLISQLIIKNNVSHLSSKDISEKEPYHS